MALAREKATALRQRGAQAPADKGGAPPQEKPPLDPLAYNVSLPQVEFEGPLDLLLHLIQAHELNIIDIPMRFITEKYLEYLSLMRALSIDVASEYLVMAAVLTHIKSKMLLPQVPSEQGDDIEQEEGDPREELVRRLLEYQKYKAAAAELLQKASEGQDMYARAPAPREAAGPAELAPLPIHKLLEAFAQVLDSKKVKIGHEVTFDRLTITERIHQVADVLRVRRKLTFAELFEGEVSRFDLVITFLALLEMSRLRMTRVLQTDPYATIHIEYVMTEHDGSGLDEA